MKNFLLASLLLLASCSPKYSENQKAWGETYWGMSSEEVSKIVGKKLFVIEDQKRRVWSFCGLKSYCELLEAKEYQIGTKTYDIRFAFESDQLSRVTVECTRYKTNNSVTGCHSNLMNLLESKYGKATTIKGDGLFKKLIWETDSKTMSLKITKCIKTTCDFIDNTYLWYSPNPKNFQAITPDFKPTDKNRI